MKFLIPVLIVILSWMGMGQSGAQTIAFGPDTAKIFGYISYSVVGKYKARFNSFKGRIALDEKWQRIRSVYLEINAGSIKSNHPWYDRIVRSPRALYTAKYPKIIFKSDEINQDKGGYMVRGILEMHGVKRRMVFPFKVGIAVDRATKRKLLVFTGHWKINRKDFNIVWNRLLDRGGVLVGDYFTVNWVIKAYMNP